MSETTSYIVTMLILALSGIAIGLLIRNPYVAIPLSFAFGFFCGPVIHKTLQSSEK